MRMRALEDRQTVSVESATSADDLSVCSERYDELSIRWITSVPPSELFLSKRDDVIIPSSGETKIDIAKASCVLAANIALGGDLNVIRSKLNGTFLSYYLN